MAYKDPEKQREYARAHYRANKERYLLSARKNMPGLRHRNRTLVLQYLREHPCVDCGETDPVVLQFDHVRGEKVKAIGTMVNSGVGLKTLRTEISKCEIRCANCHFRRTAKVQNWYAWDRPE